MLNDLKVINLPSATDIEQFNCGNFFVLKTCQRTLILGFHHELISFSQYTKAELHTGPDAYKFLLEVICGLKSKLVGENEIVSQFKESYSNFLTHPFKNPLVIDLLNKLFQDAKKIRSKFLTHIGQLSYSGIVKKIIKTKTQSNEILIFGSGNLTLDLIKVLLKRNEITICARNNEKLERIRKLFDIQIVEWTNRDLWKNQQTVVNTIGANDTTLFKENEFKEWKNNTDDTRLFIDLGSPSVVDSNLSKEQGLYLLENIFGKGQILDKQKCEKVEKAKEEIEGITLRRKMNFSHQIPFGWEELKLA